MKIIILHTPYDLVKMFLKNVNQKCKNASRFWWCNMQNSSRFFFAFIILWTMIIGLLSPSKEVCTPYRGIAVVDLCWPQMTSISNMLVLNMGHMHTKNEISPSFPILKYFHILTSGDLKWLLTSSQVKHKPRTYWRSSVYNLWDLHTLYLLS